MLLQQCSAAAIVFIIIIIIVIIIIIIIIDRACWSDVVPCPTSCPRSTSTRSSAHFSPPAKGGTSLLPGWSRWYKSLARSVRLV